MPDWAPYTNTNKLLEEVILLHYEFAERVNRMQSSAIREILKIAENPEIISFAGGLPAPELFPLADIRAAFDQVLSSGDTSSVQYSTTEGYLPLREHITEIMERRGIQCPPDRVLTTNGSQQALDLVAKLFINKGDLVAVENPTYLGALQVFDSYQAAYAAIDSDEFGIMPDALEKVLAERKPKLIYLTPTFKNPTGTTLPLERRQAVCHLLARYRVPLIEDDPYTEIRFNGTFVPTLKSMDRSGCVIYLSSFSKTVAPGLRMGWIAAEPEIISTLVKAKQAADLHTSSLVQQALYQYLTNSDVSAHIDNIRTAYGARRNLMIDAIKRHFPPGVHWTEPDGGMFLWITLPGELDTTTILPEAVDLKVAYVPGSPFFANGGGENCMRLNFSNASPDMIESGVERLAVLFSKKLTKG